MIGQSFNPRPEYVERPMGLSSGTSRLSALANQAKTAALLSLLTLLLILLGKALFGISGMWLFLAIGVLLNGASYWFSDRIALAAAGSEEVSPSQAPALHRLADRLAAQYGVPKPRVFVSADPSPNAFATGRNPRHAAICVNAGLLRILDEDELYGVLAHEYGHVGNRDILISSVVAVVAGAITVLANIAQWGLLFGGRADDEEGEGGGFGALLMVILAPIAALLIQLAISRAREYEADRTGAAITGRPLALASALRKLQLVNEQIPTHTQRPAFAHLYIVNPLSGRGLAGLFSTHPPLDERVRRLQQMAGAGR